MGTFVDRFASVNNSKPYCSRRLVVTGLRHGLCDCVARSSGGHGECPAARRYYFVLSELVHSGILCFPTHSCIICVPHFEVDMETCKFVCVLTPFCCVMGPVSVHCVLTLYCTPYLLCTSTLVRL